MGIQTLVLTEVTEQLTARDAFAESVTQAYWQ